MFKISSNLASRRSACIFKYVNKLSSINASVRSFSDATDTPDDTKKSIFVRSKEMFKKYWWPCSIAYGSFYLGSLGTIYTLLDNQVLQLASLGLDHQVAIKSMTDLCEKLTGNTSLGTYLDANPKQGTLAVSLVANEMFEIPRIMAILYIVPKIMNRTKTSNSADHFTDLALRENVVQLKSGMMFEVINKNTDKKAMSPRLTDECVVTYEGWLTNGEKFDGGTASFAPNQVIKGWTEAMQYMVEGDKWKLHVPPSLAYGFWGAPPRIGSNKTLIFDIEINKVKRGGKSAAEARMLLDGAIKK